ncbi:unnamed protein product [Mesocestoides corti]|nr:unnamed protein product [Mesocestoides corti]
MLGRSRTRVVAIDASTRQRRTATRCSSSSTYEAAAVAEPTARLIASISSQLCPPRAASKPFLFSRFSQSSGHSSSTSPATPMSWIPKC